MNEAAKKTVLRAFPYGLYAITVAHGGDEHGMTANWVTQTAFEPPTRTASCPAPEIWKKILFWP